jgi:hypothetical protein
MRFYQCVIEEKQIDIRERENESEGELPVTTTLREETTGGGGKGLPAVEDEDDMVR